MKIAQLRKVLLQLAAVHEDAGDERSARDLRKLVEFLQAHDRKSIEDFVASVLPQN